MKEIIEDLQNDEEDFKKETVEKAREHKEEIIPYLLEELEKIVDKLNENDLSIPFFADYAIYLLAEFKETKACSLILKMLDIPNADSFDYVGMGIMDKLPCILASVFDGNFEAINKIIENKKIDDYTRNRTLKTYLYFYEQKMITKEELIIYLRKLIKLYGDDNSIYSTILDLVEDCHFFEMVLDVRELFNHELIDYQESGAYADFIDSIFDYEKQYKEKVECVDDAEKWMLLSYSFKKNEGESSYKLEEAITQVIEKEKKENVNTDFKNVGRNDPCPCGSGKKYKKCCLDKINDLLPYQSYITKSLSYYPKKNNNNDEVDFYTYYNEEYIKIDELLYKALKRKQIPIFIRRNEIKEMDIDYNYLNEAYALIKEVIRKNKFKTIEKYDLDISIHYSLLSFFAKYADCMISKYKRGKKEYLNDLEELIKYFYHSFTFNNELESIILDKVDDYYHLSKKYKEAITFFENKLEMNPSCKYEIYEDLVYKYNKAINKMDEMIEKEKDKNLIDYLEELKIDYLDDEYDIQEEVR